MRVFVTGSSGFVGRWLGRELESAGHEVARDTAGSGEHLDVRDASALASAVQSAAPDGIVHLAAVSAASEASADPEAAFAVAVGGTVNLMEAALALARPPAIVVAGSSEVYGNPQPEALPLTEDATLAPRTPYALAKAGQESVAVAFAARYGLPVAVARAFNHIGPGQRAVFVVPAIARRVLDLRDGRADDVPVGNIDVRRDFTDVRDVARAYRLLLESLVAGRASTGGVYNIASGRSVPIRQLVEMLCDAAGVEPVMRVVAALVRANDPPEIRGDAGAGTALTGWRPESPLDQTLDNVWHEVSARESVPSG